MFYMFLEALKIFVIYSGGILFFLDASEETVMKLAGVLVNGL